MQLWRAGQAVTVGAADAADGPARLSLLLVA